MNNKAYAKFGGQTRYKCADGEYLCQETTLSKIFCIWFYTFSYFTTATFDGRIKNKPRGYFRLSSGPKVRTPKSSTNFHAQFAQQTKGSCFKWLKFPRHISSQQKFLVEDLTGIKGTEVVLSTANFGYLLQRKSAQ